MALADDLEAVSAEAAAKLREQEATIAAQALNIDDLEKALADCQSTPDPGPGPGPGPGPDPGDGIHVGPGDNLATAVATHPPGTSFVLSGDIKIAGAWKPKAGNVFVSDGTAHVTPTPGYGGESVGFECNDVPGVVISGIEVSGFWWCIRPFQHGQVLNCNVHDAGRTGIGAGFGNIDGLDLRISGGRVHHCGDPTQLGKGSGGIKLVRTGIPGKAGSGAVVEDVEVDNNIGPGLWWDIQSGGDVARRVNAHDNRRKGIFYEISGGPLLVDDCVALNNNTENQGASGGIVVVSSQHVTIRNSKSRGNKGVDILIRQDGRVGANENGYKLLDVVIENNNDYGSINGCNQSGVTC